MWDTLFSSQVRRALVTRSLLTASSLIGRRSISALVSLGVGALASAIGASSFLCSSPHDAGQGEQGGAAEGEREPLQDRHGTRATLEIGLAHDKSPF